jgi:hypothetical protein
LLYKICINKGQLSRLEQLCKTAKNCITKNE